MNSFYVNTLKNFCSKKIWGENQWRKLQGKPMSGKTLGWSFWFFHKMFRQPTMATKKLVLGKHGGKNWCWGKTNVRCGPDVSFSPPVFPLVWIIIILNSSDAAKLSMDYRHHNQPGIRALRNGLDRPRPAATGLDCNCSPQGRDQPRLASTGH